MTENELELRIIEVETKLKIVQAILKDHRFVISDAIDRVNLHSSALHKLTEIVKP